MKLEERIANVSRRYKITCRQIRRTQRNLGRPRKLPKGRMYAIECLKVGENSLFLELVGLENALAKKELDAFIFNHFAL